MAIIFRIITVLILLLAGNSNAKAWVYGQGPYVLPLDAQGWTIVNPTTGNSGTCGGTSGTYNGSCIIYVTNEGTDDNSGGTAGTNCKAYTAPLTDTPTTSCATPSHAFQLLRNGKADWVVLKRGQTFVDNDLPHILAIRTGASKQLPTVITAFPTASGSVDNRPIVDTGGASTSGAWLQLQAGNNSSIVILSIKFKNSNFDPSSPNYWQFFGSGQVIRNLNASTLFLLEDCEFTYGGGNQMQAPSTPGSARSAYNYIRRCVFDNDSAPVNFALTDYYQNFIIEENLWLKDYTSQYSTQITLTNISSATPAVLTYPQALGTPPEQGGLPPSGRLIMLTGASLPSGITAGTANCSSANQCYYICSASGSTANISRNSNCSPLINTTGSACTDCVSIYAGAGADVFEHNIYAGLGWDQAIGDLATSGGTIFRNNISAYAAATGSQVRPGGIIYNNLYLKNPIQTTCCGWPSEISYNVMLQSIDMQYNGVTKASYGWGSDFANYRCEAPALGLCPQAYVDNPPTPGISGTVYHHNLMAKSEATVGNGIGLRLGPAQFYNVGFTANIAAVTGFTASNNVICDWPTFSNTPYFDDSGTGGNTLDNTNLPDPTSANTDHTCASLGIAAPLTVGNYYSSIGGPGGATTDDFLNAAKTKWTKQTWNTLYQAPAVNNYIRPSYGMANP